MEGASILSWIREGNAEKRESSMSVVLWGGCKQRVPQVAEASVTRDRKEHEEGGKLYRDRPEAVVSGDHEVSCALGLAPKNAYQVFCRC